jgi:hypothetical protein
MESLPWSPFAYPLSFLPPGCSLGAGVGNIATARDALQDALSQTDTLTRLRGLTAFFSFLYDRVSPAQVGGDNMEDGLNAFVKAKKALLKEHTPAEVDQLLVAQGCNESLQATIAVLDENRKHVMHM